MEVYHGKYVDAKIQDFSKFLQSGLTAYLIYDFKKSCFPCFNSSTQSILSILEFKHIGKGNIKKETIAIVRFLILNKEKPCTLLLLLCESPRKLLPISFKRMEVKLLRSMISDDERVEFSPVYSPELWHQSQRGQVPNEFALAREITVTKFGYMLEEISIYLITLQIIAIKKYE